MNTLAQSLSVLDLGHLRIIAKIWGLDFNPIDFADALSTLSTIMLDATLVKEMILIFPISSKQALDYLQANEGKVPWALFSQMHGSIRQVGAAKRDREQYYLSPISPAEHLWYSGFIYKAFFDTPEGLLEFAYIPVDLLAKIPQPENSSADCSLPGNPIELPSDRIEFFSADRILDHVCSMLAWCRMSYEHKQFIRFSITLPEQNALTYPLTKLYLGCLLRAANLLNPKLEPNPQEARKFLELDRGSALLFLANAWLNSDTFSEIHLSPNLLCTGNWQNDPQRARRRIVTWLSKIPENVWWDLDSFIDFIYSSDPHFQRPSGDYDSWYIQSAKTQEFLQGFENWRQVEGEVIKFIIMGPLYWLGMIKLSGQNSNNAFNSFQLTSWMKEFQAGKPIKEVPKGTNHLIVHSDSRIEIHRSTPQVVRYQVARFCEWEGEKGLYYQYRITPRSLTEAKKQKLETSHLLSILRKNSRIVPPAIVKAILRWDVNGDEANISQVIILKVRSPEILEQIKQSRLSKFLGIQLGPTVITIHPKSWRKVQQLLTELGYLPNIDESIVSVDVAEIDG